MARFLPKTGEFHNTHQRAFGVDWNPRDEILCIHAATVRPLGAILRIHEETFSGVRYCTSIRSWLTCNLLTVSIHSWHLSILRDPTPNLPRSELQYTVPQHPTHIYLCTNVFDPSDSSECSITSRCSLLILSRVRASLLPTTSP